MASRRRRGRCGEPRSGKDAAAHRSRASTGSWRRRRRALRPKGCSPRPATAHGNVSGLVVVQGRPGSRVAGGRRPGLVGEAGWHPTRRQEEDATQRFGARLCRRRGHSERPSKYAAGQAAGREGERRHKKKGRRKKDGLVHERVPQALYCQCFAVDRRPRPGPLRRALGQRQQRVDVSHKARRIPQRRPEGPRDLRALAQDLGGCRVTRFGRLEQVRGAPRDVLRREEHLAAAPRREQRHVRGLPHRRGAGLRHAQHVAPLVVGLELQLRRRLGALRGPLLGGEQGRFGGRDGLVQRVLGGVAAGRGLGERAAEGRPDFEPPAWSMASYRVGKQGRRKRAAAPRRRRPPPPVARASPSSSPRGPRRASRPAGRRRRAPWRSSRAAPAARGPRRGRAAGSTRARTPRPGGRRRRSCGVSGPGACLAAPSRRPQEQPRRPGGLLT